MRRLVPLVLLLGLTSASWAQIKVTNPGFGKGEVAQYTETVGTSSHGVETALTLVGDGPSARWEYRSVAPELEALYRLDPVSLVSLSSETLTKASDATVRRTAEYRDLKVKVAADEIAVTDMGSLPVVLRGFPWGQKSAAKIVYVGNASTGGASFSFELTVVGREKVTAAGRTWDCWKVTTGLGGAFALVMAKSEWWFAVEGSHPLIKLAGPAGGPGSPTRTLLLQSLTSR